MNNYPNILPQFYRVWISFSYRAFDICILVNIGSDILIYISNNKLYRAADELEYGLLMGGDDNCTDKGCADRG